MAPIDVLHITAREALAGLNEGKFTSRQFTQAYLDQISSKNDWLRAVTQINPKALSDADDRDRRREENNVPKGRLHGLPVLLKTCLNTVPELGMETSSGNFVLRGSRPRQNAKVVQQLIDSGAVIIGKASLSELSFWKINDIPAGWSPVGGQGQNPYVRGGRQSDDPMFSLNGSGGSSSGPSIAVAAGFAPIAIGTETSGSLVFPADRVSLYTIKPTPSLISPEGIVPISSRLDTAGPLAKCSYDVALFLDVLVDRTKTGVPPEGYVAIHLSSKGWSSLGVGVLDPEAWLWDNEQVGTFDGAKEQIVREARAAYDVVRSKVLSFRQVQLHPSVQEFAKEYGPLMGQLYGTAAATFRGEDILEDEDKYAVFATPNGEAGREIFERTVTRTEDIEEAQQIYMRLHDACFTRGIQSALRDNDVDVLLGPANSPLYHIAAAAGCPIATLPLSYLDSNGCPFGLFAIASVHEETLLITVQKAWEETFPSRKAPAGL